MQRFLSIACSGTDDSDYIPSTIDAVQIYIFIYMPYKFHSSYALQGYIHFIYIFAI